MAKLRSGEASQGSRASALPPEEVFRIDPLLYPRLNGGDGHRELRQLIDHATRVAVVPGSAETVRGEEIVLVRPYGKPDGPAVRVNRRFVIRAVSAATMERIASREAQMRAKPQVKFVASD